MEPCNYPVCRCPSFGGAEVLCSAEQRMRLMKPGVYLVTTGGSSSLVGDSLDRLSDEAAAALLGCVFLRFAGFIGEMNTLGRPYNQKASELLGCDIYGGVLLEYEA